MKLKTRLAVAVCKASGAMLRRLGRGGTNLPGKLALKIDKDILGELSRGVKVTVVTGTNGKTTTSRMIEQAFADAGLNMRERISRDCGPEMRTMPMPPAPGAVAMAAMVGIRNARDGGA